jgi:hypothetical protein
MNDEPDTSQTPNGALSVHTTALVDMYMCPDGSLRSNGYSLKVRAGGMVIIKLISDSK